MSFFGVLGTVGGALLGGPAGASVGGMLGGAIDGNNAQKKQEKAQKAAQNQQIDLQKEQMQMAKDRIADFDKNYAPLEQILIEKAKRGQQADVGGVTARANADINQQFANSLATQQRNLGRLGFNQSLKLAGSDEAAALARAKALAGGITSARENERKNAESNSIKLLGDVTQIGVNKLNNAQSNLNAASNNLASTYGNIATAAGNNASAINTATGSLINGGMSQVGTLLGDYILKSKASNAVSTLGMNSGGSVFG